MKIKIGCMSYDLKPSKTICKEEGLAGKISFNTGMIEIQTGVGIQMRKEILWHEVVHGILEEIQSDKFDDEVFVDTMARQLMMLHDNNNFDKIYDEIGGRRYE